MKKELIKLLMENCCYGKMCDECKFLKPSRNQCYLEDIITIIRKYENEKEIEK